MQEEGLVGRHQSISARLRENLFVDRQCIYKTGTDKTTGSPIKVWYTTDESNLVRNTNGAVVYEKKHNPVSRRKAWLYGWGYPSDDKAILLPEGPREMLMNGLVIDEPVTGNIVPLRTRKTRRVNWNDGERGCASCPLQETWPTLQTPQMKLHSAAGADILVMGEGPGAEEDKDGRPFVGQAGRLLYKKALPRKHLDRLALTNAVRCRPAGNRTPTAREMFCCSTHLEDDIAAGKFKAILGLGGAPLSQFFSETGITQVHGLKFPVKIGDKTLWYFPTFHPSFILRTGDEMSPYLPLLQNDIEKFFKRVDKWKPAVIESITTEKVVCAYNEDEARGHLAKLQRAGKPIGFDIETTGLRPNEVGAAILSAAVSNGEVTVAWPVHHPQSSNTWGLPLLLEVTQRLPWIAHNTAFELAWLYEHARQQGIPWEPLAGYDDSMVAARLYHRREGVQNLGVLTRLYCGVNIKTLSNVDATHMAQVPLSEVLPYNGLDAWGSWRIFKQLRPFVNDANYASILATIGSVTQMQLLGLDVDQPAAERLFAQWTDKADSAQGHAKTVYEVKQFERQRQAEFNIGSTEHVGIALMEYGKITLPTTAGSDKEGAKQRYSTDDAVLSKLDNPLAHDVLQYRHAKKMVSTYIEPLLQAKTRFVDGRIHPVYSTVLTRTLRLSCEDPNAQNFPKRRDRELRTPIIPPPGCLWASADYGQLEARVYGMASRDAALCDSLIAEEDIHTYWLDMILREYPPYLDRLRDKVTPNDTETAIRKGGRDIIKSDFVFASFFGTTAKNVAERTGIPIDIATDVLGRFWGRYDGAYRWLKGQRKGYSLTGSTSNLCGVERYGHMPGNEMINTPIQSTAARLVLEAQNELWQMSKEHADPHFMPRINIHDDLTFALPDDPDLLKTYVKIISQVLVKVRFDWQTVPLKVEWKVGYNWAELADIYAFTGDYKR